MCLTTVRESSKSTEEKITQMNQIKQLFTQGKKNHIERICPLYTKPLSQDQYLQSNYNINTEY